MDGIFICIGLKGAVAQIIFNVLQSPPPMIQWHYPGNYNSGNFECVVNTNDGGYILGGSGLHLVKINSAGVFQWDRYYGGPGGEWANAIKQTSDGGYIVVGGTNSNGGDVSGYHQGSDFYGSTADIWIIKLNSAGNLQWQKCVGTSYRDFAYDVIQTNDNGYLIAGKSDTLRDSVVLVGQIPVIHKVRDQQARLVKLSSNGTLQWEKLYGGFNGDETAYSVQKVSGGGYAFAGYTSSNDAPVTNHLGPTGHLFNTFNPFKEDYYDGWVVRVDDNGNIIWNKCIGGTTYDQLKSIKQTADGGFIVSGSTTSITPAPFTTNHGLEDCLVTKLTSNGTISWTKLFGAGNFEDASSVVQTADGGYTIGAYSFLHWQINVGDFGSNDTLGEGWLFKLNASGNIVWEQTYINNTFEVNSSLITTNDGGYIFYGAWGANKLLNCDVEIIASGSTTICEGSSVVLTARSQNPPSTYQWSTGEHTASISVSAAGSYFAAVNGCPNKTVKTVAVKTNQQL